MNASLPRTLAAFGAGMAAWEALVHLSLLVNRQTPRLFGIRLGPSLNLVQTVVPGMVAIGLAAYALGARNKPFEKRAPSPDGVQEAEATAAPSLPVLRGA